MNGHAAAVTAAFIASFGVTPAVRWAALRMGFIDKPGPRKIHDKPMPLMGGLAVYVAVVLAVVLVLEDIAQVQGVAILAGASLLLVVGVLDERGLLHHQVKLVAAMPLAAVILIVSDVRFDLCPVQFLLPESHAAQVTCASATTLIWVVGITAAFSILDHMDGLSSGVAAIAAAFFVIFAVMNEQVLVGTLAAAVLGGSLGFLSWNFHPAKIFMGDGGAMLLGFLMAVIGVKLRFPGVPEGISWAIPILILGIPVFDTALIIVSRLRRGLMPFSSPGKDHTAHRLAAMGLGQTRVVLLMYVLGALLGLAALTVALAPAWTAYAMIAAAFVTAVVAMFSMERAYSRANPQTEIGADSRRFAPEVGGHKGSS